MAVFSVDSDEMDLTVTNTQTSIETVRAEVQTLLTRLEGLQTTWQGGASSAFQAVVEDWRATQLTVEQSLENINAALGTASASYGNVEQDVHAMFAA